MSHEQQLEVLRRVFDAFNRHDLDAIMSCFAAECVLEAPLRRRRAWGSRFVGHGGGAAGAGGPLRGDARTCSYVGRGPTSPAAAAALSEWTIARHHRRRRPRRGAGMRPVDVRRRTCSGHPQGQLLEDPRPLTAGDDAVGRFEHDAAGRRRGQLHVQVAVPRRMCGAGGWRSSRCRRAPGRRPRPAATATSANRVMAVWACARTHRTCARPPRTGARDVPMRRRCGDSGGGTRSSWRPIPAVSMGPPRRSRRRAVARSSSPSRTLPAGRHAPDDVSDDVRRAADGWSGGLARRA